METHDLLENQTLPRPSVIDYRLDDKRVVHVVRDDFLPGGTKQRAVEWVIRSPADWPVLNRPLVLPCRGEEFVYASPVYGFAQVALALTCRNWESFLPPHKIRATIFTPKHKERHKRTVLAEECGARIIEVKPGYMSQLRSEARKYSIANGAVLLPFGLNCGSMLTGIAIAAMATRLYPSEVWCVAGSGTLTRGLQKAWPGACHHAIRVGTKDKCDTGNAHVHDAPEKFHEDAKLLPPFPSTSNYDAKAWQFILEQAKDGAVFWNVAA